MSFHRVLSRMRLAAAGPQCGVSRGKATVDQQDLAELLRQFDSMDKAMRAMHESLQWKPAAGVLPAFIPEISVRLLTQDDRITADPLFVVFQKREMVVEEGYDHDRIAWYDSEDCEEVFGQHADELEAKFQAGKYVLKRFRRVAMKEVDEFVTACFTEQGCKDFLAINGHNLKKPFIYAASLYRNREMIDLRNWLMLPHGSAPAAEPGQDGAEIVGPLDGDKLAALLGGSIEKPEQQQ